MGKEPTTLVILAYVQLLFIYFVVFTNTISYTFPDEGHVYHLDVPFSMSCSKCWSMIL